MRILLSYYYYANTDLDALAAEFPTRPEIFADCGAFSAMTQGALIDVNDYAKWLERWKHLFVVYANLDVINDDVGSRRNQDILEDRGLHPLPVFHGAEPWSVLEDLCSRYSYVALGGLVAKSGPAMMRHLVKCFQVAREHGTYFHGFGMTQREVLDSFPWYSLDSSSWGAGHRFGQLNLWNANTKRFVKATLGQHDEVYRHAQLIREHGGDPGLVSAEGFGLGRDKDKETRATERAEIIGINATAWMRYEQYLRNRHGVIGPPAGYPNLGDGPGIYLADSRGGVTEHPDLVVAAKLAGPRVFLADGGMNIIKLMGRSQRERQDRDTSGD